MSTRKYLEALEPFDITKYNKYSGLLKDCVPFTGSPRKHPYDDKKLILICEPLSQKAVMYEFRINDIVHVEDRPNLVTESGEAVPIVQIWIQKGKTGIQYVPFEVDIPLRFHGGYDALCEEP
ncbi:MAG TPA: hypothetical protein PLG43_08630 [Spirochaetia bacterium]|nr:hypothetical protein [Spirochaetia bacterium]